MHSLRQAAISV